MPFIRISIPITEKYYAIFCLITYIIWFVLLTDTIFFSNKHTKELYYNLISSEFINFVKSIKIK